jgi:hypothetical protein
LFLFRPTQLGVSAHVNFHQLACSVVASTLHYSCFSRAISHALKCDNASMTQN